MLPIVALFLLDWKPAAPDMPLRQPQLAVRDAFVALSYGAGREIWTAASSDGGVHFGKAVRVARVETLPLGRHRGPRVTVTNGVIVVTAVADKGDLLSWRSADGGKSWGKGRRVNDVPGAAREGLHALASDAKGRVFAAWLDLRRAGTRLYGAFSLNAGVSWSPNVLIYESPDGTICECCHPSAEIAEDGTVWLMWRNNLAGARDLYVTRSRDGLHFAPAKKTGNGTWTLNACPMDGGGLATSNQRVVTAWRRESSIYFNEPGKPELRVGGGRDVTLTAARGRATAAWTEGPALRLWHEGASAPETLAEHGAAPALAALFDGTVLAAWEEQDGGIVLRRLP